LCPPIGGIMEKDILDVREFLLHFGMDEQMKDFLEQIEKRGIADLQNKK
jgi:hypothetical protein